ncbi:peptidoglycan-binding domain-containing protein [Streptomyces formicae]|uniref:Peptidoglycan-binding protein n=1 Tax=Streptomyces formicae TaxID=1616117 RepID=A0ABY3WJ03_9ACTN|nr:peptidoglycan-binding domain-containing protein [Streptomyces formicae]UNM12130.1 peptidoglycan-binding protein [Streptomyces formicae]
MASRLLALDVESRVVRGPGRMGGTTYSGFRAAQAGRAERTKRGGHMRQCGLIAGGAVLFLAASLGGAAPQAVAAPAQEGCSYAASTDRPVLLHGRDGHAVRQAQCLSNRWGGEPPKLTVDGVFDGRLLDKIRWIQGCHGLPRSGVVDPSTWHVLYHPAPDCYDPYPG